MYNIFIIVLIGCKLIWIGELVFYKNDSDCNCFWWCNMLFYYVNSFLCDLIYLVWKRIFGERKEKFIVRKDNMYFEEGYITIIG